MRSKKLVHGVGINDVGYQVYVRYNGRRYRCPFYVAWDHMLTRCYSSKFQCRRPSYIDCSVTPEWHSLSVFREWMQMQPWEGNHLDKDILVPGNKVYGPDTCIFVSRALNNFMTDHGSSSGEWPLGVTWDKRDRKFIAACCNPFTRKRENLGGFDSPDDAHEAWRQRKHQHACTYADLQEDPRVAQALRARFASAGV